MAELQQTGVEAIVENLGKFLSDVDTMNSKIGEIGAKGNLLTRALGGAWEMLENFGASVVHVAEYALGQLLADAIEAVLTKIRELISATIQAGAEFQTMEIRLNRLNFNTMAQDTNSYTQAMSQAKDATKEQLEWIQKLAVTTPYDAQDIANVYTLAQSYGFAADAGKDLGLDTIFLADKMNLSAEQTEKLSTSLGAMINKGSLLGYELDKMRRMGFPVAAMLKDMQEEAGLTGAEFTKFIRTGEGVNAFLGEFQGLIGTTAKTLTRDITDFAAGMGLGNTEIERIIVNFGQMQQQGKVTQRELNDLARGAFVPVNAILDIMKEKTGLAGDAFDEFRNSLGGVNLFMESFSELVQQRFQGAAEDMSKTFQGATANAQDFVKSLFGFGVVRPVLGAIGETIAKTIGTLTEEKNWDRMTSAAGRIGDTLASMIRSFTNLGPGAKGLAENIVSGLEGVADWLEDNRLKILKFFVDMKAKILEVWEALKARDFEGFLKAIGLDDAAIDKITAFKDGIVEAFNTIKGWVDENGPLIKGFFNALGQIAAGVFQNFAGGEGAGGLESFLGFLKSVMEWVINHQENLISFITLLIQLQIILGVIGIVAAAIAGPIMAFIGFLFTIGSAILFVLGVIAFLTSGVGLLALAIVGVIVAWSIWGDTVTSVMSNGIAIIGEFLTRVKDGFVDFSVNAVQAFIDGLNLIQTTVNDWTTKVVQKFQELVDRVISKFKSVNWAEIGRNIIQGIIAGITSAVGGLVTAVGNAVQSAVTAAQHALKAKSPSKVFMEIGEGTMEGMAMGITRMAGLASSSMEKAMAQVAMPAFALSGGAASSMVTNNTTTTNYGLTINSSAPVEPMMQDFNTLKSLAGA